MCVMYKYLHAMRVHHFFSRLSTLGLGKSGVGGDAREETGEAEPEETQLQAKREIVWVGGGATSPDGGLQTNLVQFSSSRTMSV